MVRQGTEIIAGSAGFQPGGPFRGAGHHQMNFNVIERAQFFQNSQAVDGAAGTRDSDYNLQNSHLARGFVLFSEQKGPASLATGEYLSL
jgi:hypothetical protein